MTATLPASVARFVHGLSFGELPAPVVHQARRSLVDLVAAYIGGLRTDCAGASRRFALQSFGAPTESGVRIWLHEGRLSPPGASFVHAMTIDAMDSHPGYRPAKGHAGVAVLPAALAIADSLDRPVSAREVLTAFTMGYEVALRCGAALHKTAGDYHSSGAWSAIGCALAAARLLDLSPEETAHAAGAAEYYGPRAPMMRLIAHPSNLKDSSGWGAMGGVSAALLAKEGFTGAPATLLHEREQDELAGLGDRWELLELYFKPYACCRWAHPPIDAAFELQRERRIAPSEIARIEVHSFREALALHVRRPRDTDEAQYSLPFALASALTHGRLGAAEVTGESLTDELVLALADRVELVVDEEAQAAFPRERYARVVFHLQDGSVLRSRARTAHGDPEDPLSDAAIQDKLERYSEGTLNRDQVKRLADLLWGFGDENERAKPVLEALAATKG